jgi:hypothetical protein
MFLPHRIINIQYKRMWVFSHKRSHKLIHQDQLFFQFFSKPPHIAPWEPEVISCPSPDNRPHTGCGDVNQNHGTWKVKVRGCVFTINTITASKQASRNQDVLKTDFRLLQRVCTYENPQQKQQQQQSWWEWERERVPWELTLEIPQEGTLPKKICSLDLNQLCKWTLLLSPPPPFNGLL